VTEPTDDDTTDTGSRSPRRRWLIIPLVAAVAAVVALCAGAGAVVAGVGHLAIDARHLRQGQARVEAACLDLEERLNRLTPPGAISEPRQRAAAIRAENAAIAPLIIELAETGFPRRADRRGRGWPAAWKHLVEARSAYADALDRRAAGGGPAFFHPPRTHAGALLFDGRHHGPRSCAGVLRRLTKPDL